MTKPCWTMVWKGCCRTDIVILLTVDAVIQCNHIGQPIPPPPIDFLISDKSWIISWILSWIISWILSWIISLKIWLMSVSLRRNGRFIVVSLGEWNPLRAEYRTETHSKQNIKMKKKERTNDQKFRVINRNSPLSRANFFSRAWIPILYEMCSSNRFLEFQVSCQYWQWNGKQRFAFGYCWQPR